MINELGCAGPNADTIARNPAIQRIDMAKLRAQQPDQFRTRKKSRIGVGEEVEALAGGQRSE